ncbi:MAG TPA: sugar transferase [Thermoanaerobaculia bacterium]|nr:sugar transferase [Thermoanaerobaculia bacterium]
MFDATSIRDEESVERYSATAEFRRDMREAKLAVATSGLKRAFDIVVAAFGLLLFLPLLAVVMVAIQIESPGPAIFRQRRTGYRGQVFTILKFRTMTVAEDAGDVRQATKNDTRVTAAGALLRKLSIDELPQLWNVLRGDMSLVGPRPPIPEEVAQYKRWQRRRLAMKPGLTCLWQISGRNDLDFDRWMQLDLEYIDSWSPLLDLKILLKTVPVVLSGRGAS